MTFMKKNFGQENFGESLAIHQIFLPPKFCIVWYIVYVLLENLCRKQYYAHNIISIYVLHLIACTVVVLFSDVIASTYNVFYR